MAYIKADTICEQHGRFTIQGTKKGCPVCRMQKNHKLVLAKYNRLERLYAGLENQLVRMAKKILYYESKGK